MKKTFLYLVVAILLILTSTAVWFLSTSEKDSFPFIIINTQGIEIPDEPKIPGTLTYATGSKTSRFFNEQLQQYDIKIERRGFTSQSFSKKSYSLTCYDQNEKKQTVAFPGLPHAKKWVLYGPYADKSLIRNVLTYDLYRRMGNYAPRTLFVNLVLNNNFHGIYVLTEKVQIGPNRIDINKLKRPKKGTKNIEGGYIIEVDRNEWKSIYPPKEDTSAIPSSYALYDPKPHQLDSTIIEQIQQQYNHFEQQLYDGKDINSWMDLPSFVDYFIISEFTKNIDAYRLSTFLYNPNIHDPKFYMGPIWDYNFAYGLANYANGFDPEGFVYTSNNYVPFWWSRLMENQEFRTLLNQRYQHLRSSTLSNNNINNTIDSLYQICEEPAKLNFEKWRVLNREEFWPNYFNGKSHLEEIDYLKQWIEKRLVFLDKELLYPHQ